MIVYGNTKEAKDDLLRLIENVPHDSRNGEIGRWLDANLGTEMFGVWFLIENEEIVGFITVEAVEGNTKGYIAFNWCKPLVENMPLLEAAEAWCRERDIYTLLFYTKRSPRTFMKKYGFTLVQSVLKKELNHGESI